MNSPQNALVNGLAVTGPSVETTGGDELPSHIGRYRVERLLGKGGFGLVYLAHDEQLQRPVAVKVPHRKLVSRPEEAEAYLTEARTVAALDHPNIVPVHDVGGTERFPCFVVSKYIDGIDLDAKLKQSRLSIREAVELIATVADALHHAHKQGLVHRDIKPGNILLDKNGKPFVADFGLALRERDFGKGDGFAGTPAYMSPEQARSEGHRVDGRSDIFSLGVVFYELLVGRRPFSGESLIELLEQIATVEVRPPRQFDDTIPKELERICLKSLAKRAADRYTTAKDLADDLRYFLDTPQTPADRERWFPTDVPSTGSGLSTRPNKVYEVYRTAFGRALPPLPSADLDKHVTPLGANASADSQTVKVVPKGLRSFDAADADFFLQLLPGPRDRDGLPDSIRFWKTRIETMDADSPFRLGQIYGPSGCGKSSLVKAGLVPSLARSVKVVYIEAAAEETEARLLKGLRRRIPDLSNNLSLVESATALRQGRFIESEQKILLVLDQFEQWLHAKRTEENTELVQALRQCDGGRLQAMIMVRDDFWLAVSRFMRELEIVPDGENSHLVDLFDPRHARKVLSAFGRAFGVLPEQELAPEQDVFLDQAVAGLADDGKIISVRLALFAEMVKGKPWTPTTLKEVGGTQGVGVTFLEEAFVASSAPPQHRLQQNAAQAVLKALLPDAGTDIKGHMKSGAELLAASGYAARPRDFADLLRILDSEVRLITPTDPEGKEDADPSARQAGEKYYQLTHDYLVPSLREWLTRKQKETRRGRAELLLADRAAVWNSRPENRQLPSLFQSLSIRRHTSKKNWTPVQRKMMDRCWWCQARRGGIAALFLAAALAVGLTIRYRVEERRNETHADGLVRSLLNADTNQVPAIIEQMPAYRKWTDPRLRNELERAGPKTEQKLHASLALLPVDPGQVDYLFGRLLDAEPREVPVIRNALVPHQETLIDRLWSAAKSPGKDEEHQRLRAAAALAKYDPESDKWSEIQEVIGNDFVAVPAVYLALWMDSLRPVRTKLFPQLATIFRDTSRRDVERSLATNILADFAADDVDKLADLVMDSDDKQFAVLFPRLTAHGESGLALLTKEIGKKVPANLPSSDPERELLAKRQANAAVALLKTNQPEKVWPLLQRSDKPDDPRVRSYVIHRLAPLGADSGLLVRRLDEELDITIRRALILSLGEFAENQFSAERTSLIEKLKEVYRTEDDPGLHAAVEWLLRKWNQERWLKQMNGEWTKDDQREKRLAGIKQSFAKTEKRPTWYVNTQGQTMVVIPGPVEFMMGSPGDEKVRSPDEIQHKRQINRTFVVSAKSVTLAEYRALTKDKYEIGERYTHSPDLPVVGINWYMAAAYCNLLSKEEGVSEDQCCYELDKRGQVTKLKENYLHLSGYRLPTEAEMEFATRAGETTSRYFGETDELLGRYAWYMANAGDRLQRVGLKKPNDLGLFDVQGNCYTWCQEHYRNYPSAEGNEVVEDVEVPKDELVIIGTVSRVLRGGSFSFHPSLVRSAYRNVNVPSLRDASVGFRLARTFTP